MEHDGKWVGKPSVFSNTPTPVVCATAGALALAAVHPMAEPPCAGGVGEAMPAMACTPLDSAPCAMVSWPPTGGPCGAIAPATSTGGGGGCHARHTSTKNTEERTMRKAEMVQRIAQEIGCTTARAEAAVEAILTTIKASLQQGEPVILRRFGTWQVRAKRARVGRNPKTGAAAAIPARRVVRFLAGQPFKQAVAGAAPPGG